MRSSRWARHEIFALGAADLALAAEQRLYDAMKGEAIMVGKNRLAAATWASNGQTDFGRRLAALLPGRRSCPSSRLLWRDRCTDGSRDEQSIRTRRHGKPQACDQRPFRPVAEGKAQQGSRSNTGCATAPKASGEA